MRYVILGTAGHIDHGKSFLVKALTGIDPDRLKEEKERGITIDLGFADLEYPDGLSIGIVDVPGHERLVKNMLAGAGGIDIVLLVIAADEGIMPQSREHLNICNLLKIKSGLVAITKVDLVEPEWVELVRDEIAGFVKGSFLEGAPIVPVSAKTGMNLDLLRDRIRDVALSVEPKPNKGLFRLPVDRVFTMKGFGTVVTGTAVSGAISVDEPVEVLPAGISTRVRGLHCHGKAVRSAFAGQRAALNLQGVEKDDLSRGDTLVSPGRFSPTQNLDVVVQLLGDSPNVKNRSLVHFHLGTSETIARMVLYGMEQLGPGQSCYGQLRLKDPVVAQAGDRYIIRRFSPLETIGGGEVLDPSPSRRKKKEGTDDLRVFEAGTLEEKIAAKVRKSSLSGMTKASIEGWVRAEVPDVAAALESLVSKKTLVRIDEVLLHRDGIADFVDKIKVMLKEFHSKNPLKHGMQKEEIRARLMVEPKVFGSILSSISEVVSEMGLLRLGSFNASLSHKDKSLVLGMIEEKGFQPPLKSEIAKALSRKDSQVGDILRLMDSEGTVVRINDDVSLSRRHFDRMIELLRGHFSAKQEMTVAEFRDLLGTTRKYALPFLEYLDSHAITLRVGDVRKSLLK